MAAKPFINGKGINTKNSYLCVKLVTVKMGRCDICNKDVKYLKKHLLGKHRVAGEFTEAKNLKEFIILCLLLPMSDKLFRKIRVNEKLLKEFIMRDGIIPSELYDSLKKAFANYQKQTAKLVVRNGRR